MVKISVHNTITVHSHFPLRFLQLVEVYIIECGRKRTPIWGLGRELTLACGTGIIYFIYLFINPSLILKAAGAIILCLTKATQWTNVCFFFIACGDVGSTVLFEGFGILSDPSQFL